MINPLKATVVAAAVLLSGVCSVSADELTTLQAAVHAGDLHRVETILSSCPDLVHARTEQGLTPLHLAAQTDHVDLVDYLLAAGADVAAADLKGNTPLHIAAARFRVRVVDRLIAAGAHIGARDADGLTPLARAAATGPDAPEIDALLTAVAEVLLAAGAEVNAADYMGLTPLDHAISRGHPKMAALLRMHGAARGEPQLPTERLRDTWPTYASIGPRLLSVQNNYPSIALRYDLGLSHEGRNLWAMRISDNVGVEEDEPEFRYISTMHGDEIVGVEMCLRLIDHLTQNYPTDPQAQNLVDNVDIWILPLMNPDGYDRVNRTRYNAQGIDLNRNFPEGSPPSPDPNTTTGRATETQVVMNWSFGRSFVCSANFHGGALVVNYPFDNPGNASAYTPDDDMFVFISETYSIHNTPMWNSPIFYHGITLGADWYIIDGGLQDWSYRYMGCNDVTIELGNDKEPPDSQIQSYWDDNRDAMLAYMETCLIGIRGIVTDGTTGDPVDATVTVVGRDHPIYTDTNVGNYHRMLLPGTYTLQFDAAGYDSVIIPDVVVNAGEATRVDVLMGIPWPPIAYPASYATNIDTPLSVDLYAVDDGQPDPPGALTYVITALPQTTLRDPGNDHVITSADLPYALVNGGDQVVYEPGVCFTGADTFEFKANDGGTPPDGGDSNTAAVTIDVPLAPWPQYSFNMDEDPNWTTEGQWAFGQPTGGGSYNGDPTSGHTGDNVYGYNLDGDYGPGMSATYLTTSAIDCSELTDVELRFWRWLGVEGAPFDRANLQVSTDAQNWTTVWENPTSAVADTEWTQVSYDLSAIADGQPAVYLRWGMGPTDGSSFYPGWNIDDVQIWALGPLCDESAGDIDGDGDVDLNDFATFANCYYGSAVTVPPPSCTAEQFAESDLDSDGDVDLGDFATFAANYTG